MNNPALRLERKGCIDKEEVKVAIDHKTLTPDGCCKRKNVVNSKNI